MVITCTKPAKPYLHCNSVLVHGENLACTEGVQLRKEDAKGWPVACEGLVRDQVVWHILGAQLHCRLALGQGISLCKEVAHELIVIGYNLALRVQWTMAWQ